MPLMMKKEGRKNKSSELLQKLIKVQEKYNYLPEQELARLSREIGLPLVKVYETATFYSFLNIEPKGENIIRICRSPSCYLKGSENIVKIFEGLLKISMGETTADRRFTLEFTSCMGCCDRAPAAMINDQLYVNLDREKIKSILKKIN